MRETLVADGCVLYDGDTFGDGDGLLSDEVLVLDREEGCRLVERCDLDAGDGTEIRIEATDCAGNVGTAQLPFGGGFPSICDGATSTTVN